jgi:hypothetical protein
MTTTVDYATIRVPKTCYHDQRRGYMITLIDQDGNARTVDVLDLEKHARVIATFGWAPHMGRDRMHLSISKYSIEKMVEMRYANLQQGRLEKLDRLVEKKELTEKQKTEKLAQFKQQEQTDKAKIRKKVDALFPVAKVAEFPEGSPFQLVKQFGEQR